MSKKTIIKGTIILTLAGIISRIFGFVFRIFLAQEIGSEGMGLYQLITPVTTLCYAIGISGIDIAVSRFTAIFVSKKDFRSAKLSLLCGFCMSMAACVILTLLVYTNSEFIACKIIQNPDCVSLVRISAFSFPFACVHTIITGYFIGLEKASIPATSQIIEQIVRIGSIFLVAAIYESKGHRPDAVIGVIGLVVGEIGSAIFSATSLCFQLNSKSMHRINKQSPVIKEIREISSNIIHMSLPITANRILFHILTSLEAILIPLMLVTFGKTQSEAVSIYGILTGMSLPLIFFPSALTNSLAQMLVPNIAKHTDNTEALKKSTEMSCRFSVSLGIVCTAGFVLFGGDLGSYIFKESLVSPYVKVLAWLCPFMYLTITSGSSLNALGKTGTVLINNMVSQVIRLAFVVFLIPRFGIIGYLWGALISQFVAAFMNTSALKKQIDFKINMVDLFLKPFFNLIISIGLTFGLTKIIFTFIPAGMLMYYIISGCILFISFALLETINGALSSRTP